MRLLREARVDLDGVECKGGGRHQERKGAHGAAHPHLCVSSRLAQINLPNRMRTWQECLVNSRSQTAPRHAGVLPATRHELAPAWGAGYEGGGGGRTGGDVAFATFTAEAYCETHKMAPETTRPVARMTMQGYSFLFRVLGFIFVSLILSRIKPSKRFVLCMVARIEIGVGF